jgi:hypothetical protein
VVASDEELGRWGRSLNTSNFFGFDFKLPKMVLKNGGIDKFTKCLYLDVHGRNRPSV